MSKPKYQKKDTSIYVGPQKNHVSTELSIRQLPWTEKQKEFIRLLQDKNTNIVICKGPAGSAKSICSVYCALEALNQKKIGEIVYVRSVVESSSHGMGYLPGEASDKFGPYLQPLEDKLLELLPSTLVKYLKDEGHIKGVPVGFMRGLSINSSYIIVDEAQNLNLKEILTVSTRIGKFSKLILIGDVKQSDIKDGGFSEVFDAFDNDESKEHGIETFKFGIEDIMRSEVVKYIVKKFEDIGPQKAKSTDWQPKKTV